MLFIITTVINEFISKATLREQFLSLRLVRNPSDLFGIERKIPDKRE